MSEWWLLLAGLIFIGVSVKAVLDVRRTPAEPTPSQNEDAPRALEPLE